MAQEPGMRDLTKRQAFWKAHVEALEGFSGTAVTYARQHDLDVKTLYVYKSRLSKHNGPAVSKAKFVPVAATGLNGNHGVMVALPNGVRLALPNLDTPGLLERLAQL